MRILFVTSTRLGDAVLSTGLLDYLIRTHSDARITVVCGRIAEGVFARMPNHERTIVLDKRRANAHWLPLWWEVARTRWDLVIDIRGGGLGYLVPTRRRAVWRRKPGPKIAELAAILKLDPPPLPVAWTAPADRALAERLLPADRPIIALGPTAAWPLKIWPADRFAALFRAMDAGPLPGAVPAIFAGPGAEERTLAAPLVRELPDAIDLGGKLSIPEAAACLARSSVYVGNDSGLMHLAAATGAPTLGLFGPTPVAEYAPVGRRAAVAVSPTGTMDAISVGQALIAAQRLLSCNSAPAVG